MKLTNILIIIAVAFVAVACNNKQSKTNAGTADSTVVTVVEGNNFYGTYEGTLPCADCEGIKTVLTLNEDTTYDLKSEYLGKENAVFEESGVYNLLAGNVVELVTPSSGNKTYYKIQDGAVALSDASGVLNEGELAEFYILKKK